MNIPPINGTIVDIIIITIIIFYLIDGWRRGLLLGLIDLVGFIISFIASLRLYSVVGSLLAIQFGIPRGIANASGFLLIGMAIQMILSLFTALFYRKIFTQFSQKLQERKSLYYLYRTDKVLGFAPALGEAIILLSFLLTLFLALPIQGSIKKAIVSSMFGGPLTAQTQGIDRQLNAIFGDAVNETLTFLTVKPDGSSQERVDLGFTQKDLTADEHAEQVMLNLVNQERILHGLSPLSMSFELREVARAYARDMFERGYFSHYNPEGESPFDRMNKAGIHYLAAGENLALAPNVQLAHQGLMNSPGHRANILSEDFGKVGIGVMDGGIYGQMFVQEFTN